MIIESKNKTDTYTTNFTSRDNNVVMSVELFLLALLLLEEILTLTFGGVSFKS